MYFVLVCQFLCKNKSKRSCSAVREHSSLIGGTRAVHEFSTGFRYTNRLVSPPRGKFVDSPRTTGISNGQQFFSTRWIVVQNVLMCWFLKQNRLTGESEVTTLVLLLKAISLRWYQLLNLIQFQRSCSNPRSYFRRQRVGVALPVRICNKNEERKQLEFISVALDFLKMRTKLVWGNHMDRLLRAVEHIFSPVGIDFIFHLISAWTCYQLQFLAGIALRICWRVIKDIITHIKGQSNDIRHKFLVRQPNLETSAWKWWWCLFLCFAKLMSASRLMTLRTWAFDKGRTPNCLVSYALLFRATAWSKIQLSTVLAKPHTRWEIVFILGARGVNCQPQDHGYSSSILQRKQSTAARQVAGKYPDGLLSFLGSEMGRRCTLDRQGDSLEDIMRWMRIRLGCPKHVTKPREYRTWTEEPQGVNSMCDQRPFWPNSRRVVGTNCSGSSYKRRFILCCKLFQAKHVVRLLFTAKLFAFRSQAGNAKRNKESRRFWFRFSAPWGTKTRKKPLDPGHCSSSCALDNPHKDCPISEMTLGIHLRKTPTKVLSGPSCRDWSGSTKLRVYTFLRTNQSLEIGMKSVWYHWNSNTKKHCTDQWRCDCLERSKHDLFELGVIGRRWVKIGFGQFAIFNSQRLWNSQDQMKQSQLHPPTNSNLKMKFEGLSQNPKPSCGNVLMHRSVCVHSNECLGQSFVLLRLQNCWSTSMPYNSDTWGGVVRCHPCCAIWVHKLSIRVRTVFSHANASGWSFLGPCKQP